MNKLCKLYYKLKWWWIEMKLKRNPQLKAEIDTEIERMEFIWRLDEEDGA